MLASMNRLLPAIAAALILAGCAPTATPPAEPTSTPGPTPEYATENQVASVIAAHESDWREVIDGAFECRSMWYSTPGSIPGMTCWIKEQTLITTAETAIRDLGELEIPPSMESLVESTTAVLQGIVDVDATTVCGEGVLEPVDTPECTEALGSLTWSYTMLEQELEAWAPYL